MVIQFTGLSGAGKSTIANRIKEKAIVSQVRIEVVDGDHYRQTLCSDLTYTKADRLENIRRLGKIAHDLAGGRCIAIIAAINPYEEMRKRLVDEYGAKTVYIACDLSTLIMRDTKGLYKRALLPNKDLNKLMSLSGVNDPYEIPINPDLVLDTDLNTVDECVEKLYDFICCQLRNRD